MDKGIGVEAFLFHSILIHPPQKEFARLPAARTKKCLKALCNFGLCRHAGEDLFVPDAPAFSKGELPEQKERFARLGGNPVRIAAARVQHSRGSLARGFLRELDEIIFEFEGGEFGERLLR